MTRTPGDGLEDLHEHDSGHPHVRTLAPQDYSGHIPTDPGSKSSRLRRLAGAIRAQLIPEPPAGPELTSEQAAVVALVRREVAAVCFALALAFAKVGADCYAAGRAG